MTCSLYEDGNGSNSYSGKQTSKRNFASTVLPSVSWRRSISDSAERQVVLSSSAFSFAETRKILSEKNNTYVSLTHAMN